MNLYKRLLPIVIILLLFITSVDSLELPQSMLLIKEYNRKLAHEYLQKISFPVAFIAGALSFLSPCILPIIPAFFAYTFKEKRKITRMTLVFSLGFSLVFVTFGLLAARLGKSIAMFQGENKLMIEVAGFFLLVLGIMTIAGKGFPSFIKSNLKYKGYPIDVFFMGVLFAVGWTACLGPILSGILLIAMVFENYLHSGLLMFVYSVGIFVPLFFVSILYDKFNLSQSRWMKGTTFVVQMAGKEVSIHSTQLLSGMMLILIGIVFIAYGGTAVVNNLNQLAYFKDSWYIVQREILDYPSYFMFFGLAMFIVLLIVALSGKNESE